MRKRLGGRIAGERTLASPEGLLALGSFVKLESRATEAGATRVGVLLAITESSVDVYLERGTVKRTAKDLVSAHSGEAARELALVRESVLVFASLGEGQKVSVERAPADIVPGTLVEKCRYGAIVELDDRSLLAVGFRKIWPQQIVQGKGDRPS